MIARNHISAIKLALELFPGVLIRGARQVGKTTLARWLWPDASYVSLDDPAQAAAANREPDRFLAAHAEPLILDEIQYAPALLPHLKRVMDDSRRPGRFLLIGLQTLGPMAGASELLAGRAAVFSLPPLCLDEILTSSPDTSADEVLWRSGFPELWQRLDLDRDLWLGSYMATFLERDVRQALNVGDLRDFDRLLRAAAVRVGQLVSYAELARDSGISPNTAKRWLSVLEASQQVFLLKPYPRQRTKRLIRASKLYFADTGLLCFLIGFRQPGDMQNHALWGAVWENFVVSELRKRLLARPGPAPLWFWRTAQGDEVDLLVESAPETFVAVECRAAGRVSAADLKGIGQLAAEYGPKSISHARIVCRTGQSYPLDGSPDARALPLAGRDGLLAELAW
jgi:predicted AAA+ superfamily ATPase